MTTHNFDESLAMSHAADQLPFWEEVYRLAFPTMIAMLNHREDGDHQRQGIDRSVTLANSKQILIDEKVRGRNKKTGKVYDDILLEHWSDVARRSRGWVCKPLLADYIAYAIAPLGICYLLPVPQLQIAWLRHGREWIKQWGHRKATTQSHGKTWDTISTPVPAEVVFKAISDSLYVSFTAMEIDEENQ